MSDSDKVLGTNNHSLLQSSKQFTADRADASEVYTGAGSRAVSRTFSAPMGDL